MTYYLSPYRPAKGLRDAFERMFADDFINSPAHGRTRVYLPLNVEGTDEAFVVTALVPGLETDDVHIEILEDTVSIRGELKSDAGEVSYLLREIPAGEFRRTIKLPVAVEPEAAEAEISNGVLTLRVPKAEAVRPRTIEIKAK